MKRLSIFFAVLVSASAYAGGTVGGSPGLVKENLLNLASTAFNVELLPKTYVDSESFRRAQARLSVADVASVPMSIEGEEIQVRKLRDSLVDLKISKELLPDSN